MNQRIHEKREFRDIRRLLEWAAEEYNRTAVPYKNIAVLKMRSEDFPKNTLRKIMRFKMDMAID